jgi:PIN domain nuclease of toxin-antitoxin system
MRFLLDTHTFIWAISDPDRLSKRARTVIEDSENELSVSAVSFWEIAIKVRSKRLAPIGDYNDDLVELSERTGFKLIPLLTVEAATSGNLKEDTHFDPFDRMLIWQAIKRKMVLVSKDSNFKRFEADGLVLLWD